MTKGPRRYRSGPVPDRLRHLSGADISLFQLKAFQSIRTCIISLVPAIRENDTLRIIDLALGLCNIQRNILQLN
jgi:hypothetical protein